MSYGVRQFIIVDPGGNYIRIGQPIETPPLPTAQTAGRLERALVAAVTSRTSEATMPGQRKSWTCLREDPPIAGPVAVSALILRADVAHRLGDDAGARQHLAAALAIDLDATGIDEAGDDLRRARELAVAMAARADG